VWRSAWVAALRGVLSVFNAKSVVTKYCEIPLTVRLRGMP
jgi:hypothetical protein